MNFFSLHRNIKIRIFTSFLTRIVGSMVFPFIAIYFAERLGTGLAGILLLINVTISILTGFYGGYIADTIGRKKVLVLGQSLTCISYTVMAIANSPWLDSVTLTFMMMLVNSISGGLINPAAEAMLIDVSTKETRTFMYSINYWAINASVMIGSLVGGFFFKEHRFELFIGLTIVALFTLLLVSVFMTDSFHPEKKSDKVNVFKDMIHSYKAVMTDKVFLIFSLASVAVLALEFQRTNYIGIRVSQEFKPITLSWLNDFSLHVDGVRMYSFLVTENTLIVVLLTILIAKWVNRSNDSLMLSIGIYTQSIGFALMATGHTMTMLLIGGFIQTIGEMIYIPVRQALMADMMKDTARGAYMAVNGLVFQGAKMLGTAGILLGAAIGSIGMAITYILFGFISFMLFRLCFSKRTADLNKQVIEEV